MGEVSAASGIVEREARLFEAGDYPDKGLSVTEDDLERMARGFSAPVPIHLEHRPGPLRFGWLVKVWRDGGALFGKLAFTGAAWELLKESGAKALSLGLNRSGLAIEEVSIVGQPRVAGARVFSAPEVQIPFELADEAAESGEVAAMRRSLAVRDAKDQVRAFARQGKIAPGAESAALVLLTGGDRLIEFADGGSLSIAEAFARFLDAQPPVVIFGETAPAGTSSGGQFGADEQRVFEMLGVTAAEAASAVAGRQPGAGRETN